MSDVSRVSAINVAAHPEGGFMLGVFGKRTYRVVDGQCSPASAQSPLVEQLVIGEDPALLMHDSDLMLNRTQTDVIVEGHAYAHESTESFDAQIQIGTVVRGVRVFGERRVERDSAGTLRFSLVARPTRVPLSWSSAYGGFDRAAIDRYGDVVEDFTRALREPSDPRFGMGSYPRNPFGRGYLLEATVSGLANCALPLIEDPAHLVTPETIVRGDPATWPLAPLPAGLGWVSYNVFPRTVQCGLPVAPYNTARIDPSRFEEVRAAWVKPESVNPFATPDKRVDLRFTQSAAPQMRGDVRVGAKARLVNLHPRHREWSFSLPASNPQIVARLPGEGAAELTPRIASVVIDPDEDRVTIVWLGELRTALPLADDRQDRTQHAVIWKD